MNAFTQALNGVASEWSSAMMRASWQGGIALAVVGALCVAMPKLPARARCWLWRAAYLKLLVALVWSTPVDLPLLPAKAVMTAAANPKADLILPSMTSAPIDAVVASPPAIAPAAPHISSTAILLCLWTAGVLVALAQIAREWRAAVQLRRGARPLDDPALAELLTCGVHRRRFRKPPSILISDAATGPLLLGGWRPAVVLPSQLMRDCTPAEARLAVAHEMAHYRRCDLLWCWLPRLGRALFFFHPLVLLTQREWRAAQESACDQLAVGLTGAGPAEYAAALLSVVSASSFSGPRVLALGVADSSSNLKRRLLTMKNFNSLSYRRWTSVGVALVIPAVLALVPWRVVAQQPPRDHRAGTPATAADDARPTKAARPDSAGSGAGESFTLIDLFQRPDAVADGQPSAMGVVVATEARIAPRAAGAIDVVKCREGQRVKKGEALFELDARAARARMAAAEADAQLAESDFGRSKKLLDSKAISTDELQKSQAEAARSRARLESAQLELEQTRVASPIDGIVWYCKAKEGEVVSTGQDLAGVINTDSLWVIADVSEAQANRVELGQKVAVTSVVVPDKSCAGRVTFISPRVDPATGTVQVKASVENKDGALKPGTHVRLQVKPTD